jgi:MarR family transcriptional regulator, lower aerobic nicotinate degradation pathway regulator
MAIPTTTTVDSNVAEFAGQLFFRLWRASHMQIADALKTVGLTPALFGVLNFLGPRNGAKQQEIGSKMGIDPSTMVSLLDELETAGLAERRPHPTDRRARDVVITPKGRRLLARGRRMANQVDDEVLRGLTVAERRELQRLLRRALETAPPQSLWRAEEGD